VEILPENLRGQVVDRNFMYVILREDDGAEIKIPNNFFFQKIIRVMIGGNKSQRDSSESK